jgi:ankyrin repeat protein
MIKASNAEYSEELSAKIKDIVKEHFNKDIGIYKECLPKEMRVAAPHSTIGCQISGAENDINIERNRGLDKINNEIDLLMFSLKNEGETETKVTGKIDKTVLSKKTKVFICYSKVDIEKVRQLYDKLKKEGFDPWFDEESLLPGQKWEPEIKKAIKHCDFFIACLSESSVQNRGFRHREITRALEVLEEQPEGKIYLITARLEECEVPERLGSIHWVDIYRESGFNRLLTVLRTRQDLSTTESDKDNLEKKVKTKEFGNVVKKSKINWATIATVVGSLAALITAIATLFPVIRGSKTSKDVKHNVEVNVPYVNKQRALDEKIKILEASSELKSGMNEDNEKKVELSIYNGADLGTTNYRGDTVLIWAIMRGHKNLSLLSMEKGVDVNAKNKEGMTALMEAAERGDTAMVRALLKRGTDVNAKHENGWTALIVAASYGHTAIVQALLEKGAYVNAREDNGWTALMYAVNRGDNAMVRALLKKGADVNVKTVRGKAALMYAVSKGNTEIVELLKQHGAME